jgi:hypothetical protein
MYWPISVPRIIAHNTSPPIHQFPEEDEAEAHAVGSPSTTTHDDGVSDEDYDARPEGASADAVEGSRKHSEMVRDSNGDSSTAPPKHPHPSSDSGIVDVQTSRSGFIFATISKRDLTIWQTRVHLPFHLSKQGDKDSNRVLLTLSSP